MKSPMILAIAIAASLTACSASSRLRVPPSTPALLPAIPTEIDVDPSPLGRLIDGSMGALAIQSGVDTATYGVLATRFNTLRAFYRCVREQNNNHRALETCLVRR